MIEFILFFIVMIILLFVIWKVIKSFFIIKWLLRLVSLIMLIFMFVLIILGFAVYRDANDFKQRFTSSDNLFLLMHNNTIVAGTELVNSSKGLKIELLDSSRLEDMQDSYEKYEFNDVKSRYYKIMVFDTKAISSIKEYHIDELGIIINSKDMTSLMESNNVEDDAATIISEEKRIRKQEANEILSGLKDKNIKGYLFSVVIAEYFNPKNINSFLIGVKEKQVSVYAETAMFKALKLIPKFMINNILSNKTAFFTDTGNNTLA